MGWNGFARRAGLLSICDPTDWFAPTEPVSKGSLAADIADKNFYKCHFY
jgi:hypothetical protein